MYFCAFIGILLSFLITFSHTQSPPPFRRRYLCPTLIPCNSDDVCKKNLAGSCIDGFCFSMKPAGAWCSHAEECASFFYFGQNACSEVCRPMAVCQRKAKKFVAKEEFSCCKAIPIGGKCKMALGMFQQNGFHGGCDSRATCSISTAGTADSSSYCLPKSTTQWKLVAAFAIISSMILNYAYVQRRFYIATTALPSTTSSTILVVLLGNLACFVAYLFGCLSFVAPLCCCGFFVRLWLGIACKRIQMQFFVDILYTVYLIGGTILVFMNGQKHEQVFDACEILYLFLEQRTLILLGVLGSLLIVVYLMVKFVEANMIMRPSRYLVGQPIERMAVLTQKPLLNPYDAIYRVNWIYFVLDGVICSYVLPFCYAFLVGCFLVASILSSKILYALTTQYNELDLNTLEHVEEIVIFVLLLLIFMMEHFYWTLKTFRRISNRIGEVAITLISVFLVGVCGHVIFDEFHDFPAKRMLFYLAGAFLLLLTAIAIIIRKEEP